MTNYFSASSLCQNSKGANRKMLYLILGICFLSISSSFAQKADPFAKKKGRLPDSNLEQRLKPLHYAAKSTKSSARLAFGQQQDFQLHKSLSRNFLPKNYQIKTVRKADNDLPIFISAAPKNQNNLKVASGDIKAISGNYLDEMHSLMKIKDPSQEFVIENIHSDNLGQSHVKMQQIYKGVKVYGKEVVLHVKDNYVTHLNGRNIATPSQIDVSPLLGVQEAKDIAAADASGAATFVSQNKKLQDILNENGNDFAPGLFIYEHPRTKEVKLVWHVTVFPNLIERWEYFIDAHDGSIFNKYNHTCSIDGPAIGSANDLNGVAQQVDSYVVDDVHYLINTSKGMFNEAQSAFPDNGVGVIMTLDLKNEPLTENTTAFYVTSTDNTWADASSVSAHYNASVAYDYFLNTFGRNSINGAGGNIISLVNVADDDGSGLDNAFWNGKAMFYGNGNIGFTPLAGALDVGGHEMSHGVVSNTANLEYQDQSGAINESYADIFGVMIDRDDWLLGEDVVTGLFPSGALRDMEDPHNGGVGLGDRGYQPKHMSEIYTGSEDNGGVHVNSGIPNHAFFLFATSVGKDKAEQVYYRALTDYLTASSQFIDLRLAVIQSAVDLYGENSEEADAAKEAFDAVGILDDVPTDTDPDLPTLDGEDLVLFYDLSDSDPTTLYIYDVGANSYQDISTTDVFRKPTISDDGSLALFVGADHTMNAIELTAPYAEEEISPEQIWSNISISKDGNKIAAISNEEDGMIYVFDLVNDALQSFQLYNPTTAEGVQTGEVLYADAIEWDYTGQYLMYDALNAITSNTGSDIEYWDVGFIKVWDNVEGDFGDGSIQKLFTSLPEGVSIGNPSFARNSPNVVVFDMVDETDDSYYILAANIETNDVVPVFNNQKIGYPNYSRLDDYIVFDAYDDTDQEVIAANEMESDKINPKGSPFVLIDQAKWGLWFTQASRVILSDENQFLSFDFVNLEELTEVSVDGNNINVKVPGGINLNALVATFTTSPKATVKVGDLKQLSGITKNDFNDPVVYTVIAENGSSRNYTVNVSAVITAIDEEDVNNATFFPNPTSKNVTLSFSGEGKTTAKIEIFDSFGRMVYSKYPNALHRENTLELPLEKFPSGTYVVKLETSSGLSVSKVVKR